MPERFTRASGAFGASGPFAELLYYPGGCLGHRIMKNKPSRFLLGCILAYGAIAPIPAMAQETAARSFDHLYSGIGPQNFLGRAIQQTSDGGYIIAGVNVTTALNVQILKLDATGAVAWQNVYDVHGQSSDGFLVQQTSTGYIVVAVLDASSPNVMIVMNLDPDGALLWTASYPTGGAIGALPSTIEQTPDGGYLLGATNYDIYDGVGPPLWALKLDAAGNIVWQNAYHMLTGSIHSTADGGFIAAGYSLCNPTCTPWIVKLDGGGGVAWQFQYELGANASAASARQTADGGYLIAGGYAVSSSANDAWLMKLGADGNVQWQHGYSSSSCAEGFGAYDAQPAADGGYYMMMASECSYGMIAKLDADGAVRWVDAPVIASGGLGLLIDWFAPTSDGGYVSTGSVGSVALPPRLMALKADSQGGVRACSKLTMTGPRLVEVTPPAVQIAALGINVEATSILPATVVIAGNPSQLAQSNGCAY
jgi:hypothetical protein